MRHFSLILLLPVLTTACTPAAPEDPSLQLITRAERTQFEQTTGYGEVVQLMQRAAALSERVHYTTFGTTAEGRPLPLVIVGDSVDAQPATVTSGERTRVWLQATIHGGEVSGKEALLMLLRELVAGAHLQWDRSLTLLIAPIYNADGNDRMAVDNRPYQLGPIEGMGQRNNAQGLDLNRDHMKLESAEARALSRAYQAYAPHAVVDLHTTNGTEHAYHLTYSPPLHPNTHPDIDRFLRQEWLPAVTANLQRTGAWNLYYYGNIPRDPDAEISWQTFDHRPRFNNNYLGLRGRLAIISEAYAYLSFADRVSVTRQFVEALLNFAAEHASTIATLATTVDQSHVIGTRLVTRARPQRSDTPVSILLGETEELQHPITGLPLRRRLDVVRPTPMHEYGTFVAAPDGAEVVPAQYYVPAGLTPVVNLLAAHGIEGSALTDDLVITAEAFAISATSQAPQLIESHRERRIEGSWQSGEHSIEAGTLVIPMSQPLSRLAFALLEPRSDDGIVNWNLVDDDIESNGLYPILRTHAGPE